MTTRELSTIDHDLLTIATGGGFSDYINNIKRDGSAVWRDAKATDKDLKNHQWGDAAKNTGRGLLDEIRTVGDVL